MTSISCNERLQLSEEKARNWLSSVDPEDYDDLESVVESIAQSSIIDSSDTESGEEQQLGTRTNNAALSASNYNAASGEFPEENNFSDDDDESKYNDIREMPNYSDLNNDCIQAQFLKHLPQANFSNISISNANNVVVGNVIKIKGDLIVNVNNGKNSEQTRIQKEEESMPNEQDTKKLEDSDEDDVKKNDKENLRLQKTVTPKYRPPCLIVPRTSWLAMDPLDDYDYIKEPIDLVIISHTATTSATVQSQNIGIIRDIQTFHIETRGWNDIGYNFLIGCDGNVYEGRGWGIEGAHTFSYNNRSIGISFIGCFMRKLPTPRALQACKKLLQRGVDEGHLTPSYKLMGHRQCISTESPGSKLFQEIQTWEHFHDTVEDELNESEGE